jgi:hypothetical protein
MTLAISGLPHVASFRHRHGPAKPRGAIGSGGTLRLRCEQETSEHAAAQPRSAFAYVMHGGRLAAASPTRTGFRSTLYMPVMPAVRWYWGLAFHTW